MDETYINICGQWKYPYRAVDGLGHTVDFLLTAKRDVAAARQSKYLNNLIEQDHRAIKRRTGPMPGFKHFHYAARIMAGIEVMHMIRKGQWAGPEGQVMSAAELFFSLAY